MSVTRRSTGSSSQSTKSNPFQKSLSGRAKSRSLIERATGSVLETLESRRLLAATPQPLQLMSAVFDTGYREYPKLTFTTAQPIASTPPLIFRFDDVVSSTFQANATDIVIRKVGSSTDLPIGSLAFDSSGTVAVLRPGSGFGTGNWSATLKASGITRPGGVGMSSDKIFEFSYVQGDLTGDGVTDFSDLLKLAQSYGGTGTPTSGDLNNDGIVDFTDLLALAQGYGSGTLNLAVDSDNSGSTPLATDALERILDENAEDDPSRAGKVIAIANGDSDKDGIPDFLDGFNRDTTGGGAADDLASGLSFTPITIRLPSTTLTNARVRFIYDESNPATATSAGPSPGSLRIWKKDGSQARGAVTDYLAPNQTYLLSDIAAGWTSGGLVTLWIEGIRTSSWQGDKSIKVEVDDNFSVSFAPDYSDSTRVTLINAVPAYLNDPAADRAGQVALGSDGGDSMAQAYSGAVRLSDGAAFFSSTDLDPSESGIVGGHTRTWVGSAGLDSVFAGRNGNGWVVSQAPHLLFTGNSIAVVNGGRATMWFDAIDSGGVKSYRARNYELDKLTFDNTTDPSVPVYRLADTSGNTFVFNGAVGSTVTAEMVGQLASYTDSGGNLTKWIYLNGRLNTVERWRGAVNFTAPENLLEQIAYGYYPAVEPSTFVRNDPSIVGKVKWVEIRRKQIETATSPIPVRRSTYDYYLAASGFGNPGDLRGVRVFDYNRIAQNPDGTGGTEAERKYYRYDTTGQTSRLRTVFEGESFERMAAAVAWNGAQFSSLDASADTAVLKFADLVLKYDSFGRVTDQYIQGERSLSTDVTTTGSLGSRSYTYSVPTGLVGRNQWTSKTQEYLPGVDGVLTASDDQTTFYINAFGQVIASNFTNAASSSWRDSWVFDADGRVLRHSTPSAADSALTLNDSNANPVVSTLRTGDGIIEVMTYGAGAATPPSATVAGSNGGDAPFYLKEIGVARGTNGIAAFIKTSSFGYATRPVSGVSLLKSSSVYRSDVAASPAITTGYDYTFYSGKDRVRQTTTRLPLVSAAQNGSGVAEQELSIADVFGHTVWEKDGDGFVHYTKYDLSKGGVLQQIIDADPGNVGGVPIVGGPSRNWGVTLPAPLSLSTTMVLDLLGRVTQMTNPRLQVSAIQYYDDTTVKRIVSIAPLVSGGLTPPRDVMRFDRTSGVIDQMSLSAASNAVLRLSRSQIDEQNRTSSIDRYEETTINSYTYDVTTTNGFGGQAGVRYRTEYGFDFRGRQDRVAAGRDPYVSGNILTVNPTITRTAFDGLDRPISSWLGTDDVTTAWTQTTTSHPNLVKVSANEYDANGVGNSTLTKQTLFVNATAADNRVTQNYFDWRDRLVASKSAVETSEAIDVNRPISYVKYDNLDRPITSYVFDGDTLIVTTSAGVPVLPSSAIMRAATLNQYDDRGRVYRTSVFNVDQTTGVASGSGVYANTVDQFVALTDVQIANLSGLRTDQWYDPRDNVVKTKQPGGLFGKVKYDGASRPVIRYTSDGGADSTYAHALTVDGDIVLEQVESIYDLNGNVELQTTRQRNHDETATGALANSATTPKARVSFVGQWFDNADRLITTVNWGNNGGTAISTRPSTAPARANADGWDPYLVVGQSYDNASRVFEVTSARGVVTRNQYDSLDRRNVIWEGFVTTPDVETRKTTTQFNGFDQPTSIDTTTFGPGGRSFTTTYVYGITKDGINFFVNHSGLLKEAVLGRPSQAVSGLGHKDLYKGYNALGENTRKADVIYNLGTGAVDTTVREHTYKYNVRGLVTEDALVSAVLPTMADRGRKRAYKFDTLGRTTLSSLLTVSDGVINQVQNDYDGLGNLIREWQEHLGAVNGSTLKSEYLYDTNDSGTSAAAYSANRSRVVGLKYPNNHIVTYVYGYRDFNNSASTIAVLNDSISRIGFVMDGTTSVNNNRLEFYQYLGLNTLVERIYPRVLNSSNSPISFGLTFINDLVPDGTKVFDTFNFRDDAGLDDPYGGFDRFGRPVIYDFQAEVRAYAYDADGNLLSNWNPETGSSENGYRSERYQSASDTANNAYDRLGRIKSYARGQFAVPTGPQIGRPKSLSQSAGNPLPQPTNSWAPDASGNYDRSNTHVTDPSARGLFQRPIPTYTSPTTATNVPSGRRDLFTLFDGWGLLGQKTVATLSQSGSTGAWTYSYPAAQTQTLTFFSDGLGRRVTETDSDGSVTNHNGTNHLYYAPGSGQVIEERNENGGVIDAQADDHYTWSPVDSGKLVAWDNDDDGSPAGLYGGGLDVRQWVAQGADGSTWLTREDGISGVGTFPVEQFAYNTEGFVIASRGVGSAFTVGGEVPVTGMRYLWHGGRSDGDGILMMPDGSSFDTHRGTPLGDDAYAHKRYVAGTFFDASNVEWTIVQERAAFAGTQGQWSIPSAPSTWDVLIDFSGKYDRFKPSANWDADPYYVAAGFRFVGVAALTIATGGAAASYLTAAGASGTVVTIGSGAAAGFVGGFSGDSAGQLGAGQGYSLTQSLKAGGIGAGAGAFGGAFSQIGKSVALSNGIRSGVGEGIATGLVGGAAEGAVQGYATGGWSGAGWGALQGAGIGGVFGGAAGFISGRICFVAGTRVVVEVESDDSTEITSVIAEEGSTATAKRLRFKTVAIEELVARGGGEMGNGGGQFVISRDQHNPAGPLVRQKITRTYQRTAHLLQILTVRDDDGNEQTLKVTEEHPFYVEYVGWTPARNVEAGDTIAGADGTLTVVENTVESHPDGVTVYNIEVEQSHTYFVLAEESSDSLPVWVHNAEYGAYRDVGGHHIPAKSAFRGDPLYSKGGAPSISQRMMRRLRLNHDDITASQRRQYDAYAETGNILTRRAANQIEVQALIAGGATESTARRLVARAVWDLRSSGVRGPVRIPWN